jgi:hypothetical protein
MAQCRSCHAVIFWGETPKGRRAPFDPDGQNHFMTCPDRQQWRREPEPKPKPEPESEQQSFVEPPSRYPV